MVVVYHLVFKIFITAVQSFLLTHVPIKNKLCERKKIKRSACYLQSIGNIECQCGNHAQTRGRHEASTNNVTSDQYSFFKLKYLVSYIHLQYIMVPYKKDAIGYKALEILN